MRKTIASILLFLFLPIQASSFSDIENSWYQSSIIQLKNDGIVNGFDDGNFHPNNNITRAEILAIILNSSKTEIKENIGGSCFPDLQKDWWYIKYICHAHKNDITHGYSDGTFRPNGNVSVLEVLALTMKTFDIEVPEIKTWEQWYDRYIEFAHENKIIPKNAYTINTQAKRGQATQIITRIQSLQQGQVLNYNSLGCTSPQDLQDTNFLSINNKSRSYLLSLPKNYDASKPYPLVIGLHGRTNSNTMVRDYMWLWGGKWEKNSSNEVITAYPAWLWSGPYTWHEAESIDFIDAMLSEVSSSLCIDKSQVHIVWHSLGAYFSNKLSCLRWDVIATMTAVAWGWYKSECNWPVASLILHNKADNLVPYSDGQNALKIRKEINTCTWAAENINISGLNCQIWNQCSNWNPVAFCAEYSTYWNTPHSRPIQWAKWIYKFIDIVK